MLFKEYKHQSQNLAVNLWSNNRRPLDIIGGDTTHPHIFNNENMCICGAWRGHFGEESNIVDFYIHAQAFSVMNHKFNNVIIISRKIIPVEFSISTWSKVFSYRHRYVVYCKREGMFLNVYTVDVKKANSFVISEFSIMDFLIFQVKDFIYANPTRNHYSVGSFKFVDVMKGMKKSPRKYK